MGWKLRSTSPRGCTRRYARSRWPCQSFYGATRLQCSMGRLLSKCWNASRSRSYRTTNEGSTGGPGQAPAAAPGAPAPQAVPQAAPAPNGAAQNGGGADYSAQWAEYYRSIGKVKEAETIEAQMKQKVAVAAPSFGGATAYYGGQAPGGGQPAGHPGYPGAGG